MPAESTATAALWQQEQRRRFLLQQLGITPLISCPHIPGAANSRLFAPTEAPPVNPVVQDHTSLSHSPSAPSESNAQSTLTALKQAVASSGNVLTTPSPGHDGQDTPTVRIEMAEAVSFSLLIASTGPFLWVEHLPDALITREQLQLLQAIAFAVVGPDTQLGHRQFDWPLVATPQIPKDLVTARQSVAGHLTRWAREQSAQTLVTCGDETRRFITDIPGLSLLSIPSLHGMLTNPSLKREAWQHLRPLVKR